MKKTIKITALIVAIALLVVGSVLFLTSDSTNKTQAQALTASPVNTTDQPSSEAVLRRNYQESLKKYSDLETTFNDTRLRYRRLGEQTLIPTMVSQARELYQARDKMYLDYLSWIELLVETYAADGEEIIQQGLSFDFDPFATASATAENELIGAVLDMDQWATKAVSATEAATAASATQSGQEVKTHTTTQKQIFINDIQHLKFSFQDHLQQTELIADLLSWENFNQNIYDPEDDLGNVLYKIFAFTTLTQLELTQEKSSIALATLEPTILEASPNDVEKVERTKIINQLKATDIGLDQEILTLTAAQKQISTLLSYQNFTQAVRQIITSINQITYSLSTL